MLDDEEEEDCDEGHEQTCFIAIHQIDENMDDYGKFRNFHKGVKLHQLLGDEEKEDYDESYKKHVSLQFIR